MSGPVRELRLEAIIFYGGHHEYFEICKGLGVEKEHIRLMIPLKKNLEENIALLKEEFDYEGVSVIISQRECIQTLGKKRKI